MTRGRRIINNAFANHPCRSFFLFQIICGFPLLCVSAFLVDPFEKIPRRHLYNVAATSVSRTGIPGTSATTSTSAALSMMKGSVFCAVTLDGFIATPDGDVSFLHDFGVPSSPPPDPTQDPYSFESFLDKVDIMIMERKTFEKVLSFGRDMWAYGDLPIVVWTTQTDYQGNGIPDYLQESVRCSSLSPTALWDGLQNQGYEHVYIDGGSTIQNFAKE